MSAQTNQLDPALRDYLVAHTEAEHPAQVALREVTAPMPAGRMQICTEQGALLKLLIRMLGAKRCIEVGTFTGYSALSVALALPEDGTLIACDVSEEWTSVGAPYWEEAGVAGKIDLRIAPASETLQALLDEGLTGTFDFAFIDADKPGYHTYYEQCLTLLRPGGVVAIDNVLWGGSVIDEADQSESTVAIRAINDHVAQDARVEPCMIPIGDGLTLARKR